jgi:GDP-L-fucose synthase
MTTPPSPTVAVLGAGGLLGRAIFRAAEAREIPVAAARSADVDAANEGAVRVWLEKVLPDALIVCAARNAGVHENIASPATMLEANARVAVASISAARQVGVRRLLYCSSTAIYSPDIAQPYREADAGTGRLDPSHSGYAAAKLLGARFCQAVRAQYGLDYTALLLGNMYGPGQNYDPSRAMVVPSLISRFHAAKESRADSVGIWGTGEATRDLLFVDDAAEIVLELCTRESPADGLINVASGRDTPIRELAEAIRRTTQFEGQIVFDPTKPEGVRRRSIDVSRLAAMGLAAPTSLEDGLAASYIDFCSRL